MAFYISCGFKDYSDFAKKEKIQSKINKKNLLDVKLDIKDHSDDILVLIMDWVSFCIIFLYIRNSNNDTTITCDHISYSEGTCPRT